MGIGRLSILSRDGERGPPMTRINNKAEVERLNVLLGLAVELEQVDTNTVDRQEVARG